MAMTSENMGELAAERINEARPNINTPITTKPVLNAEQVKAAADQFTAITPGPKTPDLNKLDPYASAKEEFDDEIEREEKQQAQILAEENTSQLKKSGKNIKDLIEDDAYDLSLPLHAGAMYNPNILKVDLKDSNYIARWGNTNNIRQAMLAAQGFSFVKLEDVRNTETLCMFVDSQDHLVYADLVAMKIPKNVYYAGLRRAYLKSLHATQDRRAAQAGAVHAKQDLNNSLTGAERSYMANNEAVSKKDIYSPAIGV